MVQKASLCWECIHAVPNIHKKQGCEWSLYFQPVPGWTATATIINNFPKASKLQSYRVKTCPKFKRN